MPTSAAFRLPQATAAALEPNDAWLEPLEALVAQSPSMARWRSFRQEDEVAPNFVLIGPRGRGMPIRVALIAGLTPEDVVATTALAKFLVELDLAPLLAKDVALFGYPRANPLPRMPGRRFAEDFWHGSDDPAVRFIEHELTGNGFDAVIFLQGNQPISGFQIRTCSRVMATEIVWPAIELAQRFVPLAPEPVRLWPAFSATANSIFDTRHLRPRPFCLSLCTPRSQSVANQISAMVFAAKQILQHYRAAVGHAGRL
ncbi:MAG TPA: hypothetical protein VGD78_20425 [Chthoniobacterales bacterium]